MSDLTVAKTIFAQLGGNKFKTMTGACSFCGGTNDLSFRLPAKSTRKGIAGVRIELTSNDLYTLVFLKMRKFEVIEVARHEGVYCDQLQEVFTEETGLYCTL